MNRAFICVAAVLLCQSTSACASDVSKPNVVFIYADDWGWGDLSGHGHPWLATPNLDRLAAQGIDFQQFNVLNPVCSPSRVAAMTGRYPSRYCINGVFSEKAAEQGMPDWLDPQAPTIPRFLKAAGYRTAHFGKWHMSSHVADIPPMAAYGVDESAVYHGPGPTISVKEIGDRAAQFIKASAGQPFYVNVWLHESHLAHSPSAASMERWKHLDEQKQVYAAVITDGDNEVGKVLTALDEAGVAQNTIVIFSSDNGPESTGGANDKGRPGNYRSYYSVGETGGLRGRKRSIFEGGVRVPFLVRWPGHAPAGTKNDTTAFTAVDLLPTLCAAAGVTVPSQALEDGESLLDAFNGKAILRTRTIFWLHTGKESEPDWWPRLAVRDGDWKLVSTYDGGRVELHNLVLDRAESIDVAKEHPDIVERLKKLVLDWYSTLPTQPDPACVSKSRSSASGSEAKSTKRKKKTPAAEPTASKPATAATPDRARAFARWDTNHDDLLTLDEYKAGLDGKPNLDKRFKNFDKNGDGKLTRQEFIGSADP